jgi:signal transduction histidine kinase
MTARGFDPSGVAARHGMGLTLMRERVTEMRGRLHITSGPGQGTRVRADRPESLS